MRVLVLGGYGEFGGRVAQLLLRDGHDVLVAGRSIAAARRFCAAHGGVAVQLDVQSDLDRIEALTPDVVVDAVGPYQVSTSDSYRVPRAALVAGAHYLDISDDADFSAGISTIDAAARSAKRFVLSGVSSTPALSSAVVEMLRTGLDDVSLIETSILPGSRAPRGPAVVEGVLRKAGNPMPVWRGGTWREAIGWSCARHIDVAPGLVRPASLVCAPDLKLFPSVFGARSVLFRAGLEVGAMQRGLAFLAHLRSRRWLPDLASLRRPLAQLGECLAATGNDRGCMVVDVTGRRRTDGEDVVKRWTLVADPGQGPFVPAAAVRAIVRQFDGVAPGARVCLADISLEQFANAMSDLGVRTSCSERLRPTLFRQALGTDWPRLSKAVRRLHGVQDLESFSGRADVTRGNSWIARIAAVLFRFPLGGTDVPASIVKTRNASGETWERNFAGRRFRSELTPAGPGRCRERFWPFLFELSLPVTDGTMALPVQRGWLLGIPLPRALLPVSEAREFEIDGRFHFDVRLLAPLGGGLIVRYRGWLVPEAGKVASTMASTCNCALSNTGTSSASSE